MADNKWTRPKNPPPPLFLGKKERDLVKQVNDELIERVIGQQVIYYPIDIDRTDFHSVYGEAIQKSFLPPVRVHALVEFEGISTKYSKNIGLDKREGDFVLYGKFFYEIVTLAEPKQLFGQIDHRLEISAKCIRAREGLFDAS